MILKGNVLITGGSGFLGRAILNRAEREGWPAKFTVYSRDETKQWELKKRYPQVRCVLGDIARDIDRLIAVFSGHETVIHAGAVKYIPEAEHNVLETIDVNINGSRNVAMAAIAAGVEKVVGISTDKACAPLNVYGMTKAIMERLFSESNRMGRTIFSTVRYGNVVGSTGSVIPMFKRQVLENSNINVTDNRMTRFWLGPDDAVNQVVWAVNNCQSWPGNTFIPACPAMTIVELAKAVSIHTIGKESMIHLTGIRPGEKIHESLFNEAEAIRTSMFSGNQGFTMEPATSLKRKGIILEEYANGYSSENPSHWLSTEEMIEMIKSAEDL